MNSGRSPHRRPSHYPTVFFYLIFSLISLLAAAGLDFIVSGRGGKSYFFPPRVKQQAEIAEPLSKSVVSFLASAGLPEASFRETKDEKGDPMIAVELSSDAYARLEPSLKLELDLGQSKVVHQEASPDQEGTRFLWRVERSKRDRLSIFFFCPVAKAGPKPEEKPLPAMTRLAIVIDDLGNSLETIKKIIALKTPLSVSILPLSPHALETARLAQEAGLEVMLHLPAESLDPERNGNSPGGVIHSGMSEEAVRETVDDFLGRVPFIKGVNNHMGSKATQDEALMRVILEPVRQKGLFFLDSRTSDHSVAFETARKMGIPAVYRNVFLDSVADEKEIKKRLIELFRLSRKRGWAVGIGHPLPETLRALKETLPLASKYRVEMVFASSLLQR